MVEIILILNVVLLLILSFKSSKQLSILTKLSLSLLEQKSMLNKVLIQNKIIANHVFTQFKNSRLKSKPQSKAKKKVISEVMSQIENLTEEK